MANDNPSSIERHMQSIGATLLTQNLEKDVECTFGILKGRWRILKTGIRVHNTEVSDNIWMTCCALHNLLLDVDGLSHKWEDGFPSSYEADDGGVPR
jgi:hypothetical protein